MGEVVQVIAGKELEELLAPILRAQIANHRYEYSAKIDHRGLIVTARDLEPTNKEAAK